MTDSLMGALTDLPVSEAIVIMQGIRSEGNFLDEIDVKANDFMTNEAAWAYDAIRKLQAAALPIDIMTVAMQDLRIEQWIWANSDQPLHGAHYHASLVHEGGVRRRLDAVGRSISHNSASMPLADLIDTSRSQIDEAAGLRRQPIVFVGEQIDRIINEASHPRVVYETPWQGLTAILGGGFRPGALYVVAARPGIGKSALGLQMASALTRYGLVSFSSLEMPDEELIRRLIAQGAEIPHHLLERGEPIPGYAEAKIAQWRENTTAGTIAIDDRSTVGIADIRAHARSVQRQGPLAGVIVDYLQLISGPVGASRVEIVSEITRQLKIMAREMDCPVIALSQLNRNSESRQDKRPILADLRESGSIEQDADVVMMLYKEPAQNLDVGAPPLAQPLELNVAKNRHGPTTLHMLMWEGTWMRAYEGRAR